MSTALDSSQPPVGSIIPAGLREQTPSAQLIWHLLNDLDAEVTRRRIEDITGLSEWTVSHALSDLRAIGVVDERDDPTMPQRKLIRESWNGNGNGNGNEE